MPSLTLELVLKILYFNAVTLLCFVLYKEFFMPSLTLEIPMILMGNVAFFIFDYVLTVFVNNIRGRRFK